MRVAEIMAAGLAVLTLAACSGGSGSSQTHTQSQSPSTPSTITVKGALDVVGNHTSLSTQETGEPCDINGNTTLGQQIGKTDLYDFVKTGAPVTFTDASGKVVAMGQLGSSMRMSSGACEWEIDATVPGGSDFYGVKVGSLDPTTVSANELPAVALTLGQ
jgi:hypothetical protein